MFVFRNFFVFFVKKRYRINRTIHTIIGFIYVSREILSELSVHPKLPAFTYSELIWCSVMQIWWTLDIIYSVK